MSFIYFLLQNFHLFILTPHPQHPHFFLGYTPGGAAAPSAPLLHAVMHTQHLSLSLFLSLSLSHKWTLDELHFSEKRILKWRSLNCKLTGVFRKQARLSSGESTRTGDKESNTFSRYFRIEQVGSSVSGITSLYIRQPSSVPLRSD